MHTVILMLAFLGQTVQQQTIPHETQEQRHAAAMARAQHIPPHQSPAAQQQDKSNEIQLSPEDQVAILKGQRKVEEGELTLVELNAKVAEQKNYIDQYKAALDAQVTAMRTKYHVGKDDFFNSADLFFITPPKDLPAPQKK